MSTPTPVDRPLGVAVAGWVSLVSGALSIAGGVVGLATLALGLRLLDDLAVPLPGEVAGEVAPVVAVTVLLVAVVAGLGVLEAVLGVGVLRGRGDARVLLTAWNVVVAVPLAWALLADIPDPTIPLVSAAKAVDLASVLVALLVLSLLWSGRAGAWFADRARLARLDRAARASGGGGGDGGDGGLRVVGPPYAR